MAKYDWGDGHGRVHSRPKRNGGGNASRSGGNASTHGGSVGQGAVGLPGVQTLAPAAQAFPQDPNQVAQDLANRRNLQVGQAYGTYQSGQIANDTGYNSAGARDYSNPYSQAALLDESYKRSKTGTTNSYASSGQLHSGAYGRMQGENDRNYSIGSNQLQTDAARGYQGIGWQNAQNLANYGTGADSGALDAILRALGAK